jgi:Fuc2NAc and GlcNAc transferase
MSLSALLLVVFISAVLLTGFVRLVAIRAKVLDLPISRSAHVSPTPVGGGVSIASITLVSICIFFYNGKIPVNEFLALCGAALVAGIGLFDDIKQLNIRWRLPAQLIAATWSVWWLGNTPSIDIAMFTLSNRFTLNVLAILALLWLLNLYNFMDGIDGLAGSELVFVNLFALMFVISDSDEVVMLIAAVLSASGAGFLFWNLPPAKIFMGDVGSGFAGFMAGVMALLSMHHGTLTVWTWLLLLGVFITDATVTLVIRLRNGEKWYEAHNSHAYQNAARRYKSHGKVTITVLAINCLWLAPLAWYTVKRPDLGVLVCIVGLVPLFFSAVRLKAGHLADTG